MCETFSLTLCSYPFSPSYGTLMLGAHSPPPPPPGENHWSLRFSSTRNCVACPNTSPLCQTPAAPNLPRTSANPATRRLRIRQCPTNITEHWNLGCAAAKPSTPRSRVNFATLPPMDFINFYEAWLGGAERGGARPLFCGAERGSLFFNRTRQGGATIPDLGIAHG